MKEQMKEQTQSWPKHCPCVDELAEHIGCSYELLVDARAGLYCLAAAEDLNSVAMAMERSSEGEEQHG